MDRLREQPGETIIIAQGLKKGQASGAVQALKKFEGVSATSRTHDLPQGVDSIAVFAEFSEGDSL